MHVVDAFNGICKRAVNFSENKFIAGIEYNMESSCTICTKPGTFPGEHSDQNHGDNGNVIKSGKASSKIIKSCA